MGDMIYFAVANIGAGEAWVTEVGADDDYREQDITGAHGQILHRGADRTEAERVVSDFERRVGDEQRTVTYTVIQLDRLSSPADLSALDLRAAAQEAPRAVAYRARLHEQAQGVDVLYDPESGRLGAAWGGNAEWVECAGEDDVEAAIVRALTEGDR